MKVCTTKAGARLSALLLPFLCLSWHSTFVLAGAASYADAGAGASALADSSSYGGDASAQSDASSYADASSSANSSASAGSLADSYASSSAFSSSSSSSYSASSSSSLVTHDGAFVPDHILRITAQNISQACDTRLSVVVNGTSPGPEIRLRAGQPAWIRVYNDMEDANLTMHWHGLAQYMAEFSDGSPLASQWPIPPQHFFDYEVQVPPSAAGTYFYHSHVGIQALTSFGALIVEDCSPLPYAYDDERVLLWHEHYKQDDETFVNGLLAVPLNFGGEVVALMLNGGGVAINHTANENGGDDESCQLPVIEVDPGKTYRFRFIGATSLAHTIIKFEDHENLTIMAVDGGQYTQPTEVERMQIGSGQRFDVLFKAKTLEELQSLGKTDFFFQFETRDRPAIYQGYGVLRYVTDSPAQDPPSAPTSPIFDLPDATYTWLEEPDTVLQPLYPDPSFPSLSEVTRRITINASQLISPKNNRTIWELNGLTWNEEVAYPIPLLIDIYVNGEAAVPDYDVALQNYGWDPRTKSFPARVGEVLEIVIQNTGSLVNSNGGVDVHPFHAHGQHYFDIGSGNGTYDPEAWEAQTGGKQPVKRDSTMLYRYETKTTAGAPAGWRAWRIRVTDAGVWMVHCHTLQHMIMGMQSVWVVGNASEIQTMPTELSVGYFTYGGDVYGNETYNPDVYEKWDHSSGTCS